MWDELMLRFGYNTYIAQGGDWGSLVTHALLLHADTHCLAGHINLPMVIPDDHTMTSDDPVERASLAAMHYQNMSPVTPSNKAPDPRHSPTHWRTPLSAR